MIVKRLIPFLIYFISQVVLAENSVSFKADEIEAMAISSTNKTAIITKNPYTLSVINNREKDNIKLAAIDSVVDVLPHPKVMWSNDEKYLALIFNAGEEVSVVEIYDSNTLKKIWDSKATNAQWTKEGHFLLIVPNYGIDDLQSIAGLIMYDPLLKQKKILAQDLLFSDILEVGNWYVLANVLHYEKTTPVFTTYVVDIKNGKASSLGRLLE
jgi:hypothetical protein